MADDSINEDLPRLSSFKGRLDMENFRFNSGSSSQLTAVRQSTRLSPVINTAFKPMKPGSGSRTSASKPNKRKAEDTEDSVPASPEGSTEAESAELSASARSTPVATPKKKRNRQKSGYAPPSVYAHLPLLPDALAPNLLVLFIGLNPGIRTAQTGHSYNHPSNLFWKLMYSSGVLPVRCTAEEDRTLPARFSLGLTNIVARPSRNGAELSKAEMDDGVSILEDKIRRWRPEVVCVVGKSIWESVWRVRHGKKAIGKAEFRYGWQDEEENMGRGSVVDEERIEGTVYSEVWNGAKVFVASSTSGLAATLRPEEKERIWRELGVWVEQERSKREAAGGEP